MTPGIILDFDGVIVESVDIKTEAFRLLFADENANLEQIVALHLTHGGLSRFEKFRMIYRDILRRPLSDGDCERLGSRFSQLVVEAVIRCPFVPGAVEFLAEQSRADVPLFLISGTPESELLTIVERRGLNPYFRSVHGSPRTKTETVRDLLGTHCGTARAWVFVGDSLTDWSAATETGTSFVGRVKSGMPDPFPPSVPRIANLFELSALCSRPTVRLPEIPLR